MTKSNLVDAIAEKSGLSKKDAGSAVDAFVDSVMTALAAGDKVTLTGFGSFEVSERSERTGRNPSTGEAITIPASKTPKFKAGKLLKDAVNK